MGALILGVTKLWGLLVKFVKFATPVAAQGNLLGWGVSIAASAAVIILWVAVLKYAFTAVTQYFVGSMAQIFDSNFPTGALWLLNQTFPLSLMFSCAVGLLTFQSACAGMVAFAITATRKLKGG